MKRQIEVVGWRSWDIYWTFSYDLGQRLSQGKGHRRMETRSSDVTDRQRDASRFR